VRRLSGRCGDQVVEHAQLRPCVLDAVVVTAQCRAPGAVDHRCAPSVQPPEGHRRAPGVPHGARADHCDLDQQTYGLDGRGDNVSCASTDLPQETVRGRQDATGDPPRPRRHGSEPDAGCTARPTPRRSPGSSRPTAALDDRERQRRLGLLEPEPAGVVVREAAGRAEPECIGERPAAASTGVKGHRSLIRIVSASSSPEFRLPAGEVQKSTENSVGSLHLPWHRRKGSGRQGYARRGRRIVYSATAEAGADTGRSRSTRSSRPPSTPSIQTGALT
jgi:hypothetical protein